MGVFSRVCVLACVFASAGLAAIAPFAAAPAASASTLNPAWTVEQSQMQYLYPYRSDVRAAGLVELSEGGAVTGAEHYTRIASCNGWRGPYQMPCNSLTDHPPAAGSIALYDPESWSLTPSSEYADPCASWRKAAGMIRPHGAVPAVYLPYRNNWQERCAGLYAGPGGWVFMGQQQQEQDTSSYVAKLNQIYTAAHTQAAGLHFSFALSTRAKYGASVWRMWHDWSTVRAAHPHWNCWLNVITYDGSQWKARQFLARIYG